MKLSTDSIIRNTCKVQSEKSMAEAKCQKWKAKILTDNQKRRFQKDR